jgi:hypothetical protein
VGEHEGGALPIAKELWEANLVQAKIGKGRCRFNRVIRERLTAPSAGNAGAAFSTDRWGSEVGLRSGGSN